MDAKKGPTRKLVDTRLELAYNETRIGRALQTGKGVDVSTAALPEIFEFLTAELIALQETVKMLATEMDNLRSR